MRRTFTLICLTLLFSGISYAQHRTCGAMETLEYQKQQDPGLEQRMEQIEQYTQQKVRQIEQNREINGDIITIPVVVHIIYTNSTNNISNAQIMSQIDVLNEDFRRLNSDADGTWSQAADAQIEFCMANVDPNGNTTTGITRKASSQELWITDFNNMKKSANGGTDAWDTSEYLNMWVVPRLEDQIGRSILGYAQFPGGDPLTDGVVMGYNYFGNIENVSAPFDLGRTTTHEVGHFLNLRHIWGDGGCGVDDFVTDTPESDAQNYGCNPSHVSCGTVDMVQNYMDYSDDSCMNLFTQGQADRMRATLLPGGVRASLGASTKCNGGGTQPTCDDGIQNGDEQGVDCGGSSCPPCQISCSTTINSFPYNQGFENTFGAWSQSAADDFDWSMNSGSTGSSNTGPSSASEGTYYIYMESSTPNYSTKRAILESPCFDLASGTPQLDFQYHMYGSSAMGSLALELSTDGVNWTSIWSASGNQGDAWLSASVDLSSYLGSTVKLRFNGVTGTTWQGDMAVDDLKLITEVAAPTCDDGIQNGDETGVDCGGSSCPACPSNVVLHEGYFESGWDNWTDGGGDCARYSGSRSSEGSYSIRIRDNSGTASAMTSETFDVSSYSQVEVSFSFYSYSMESGEDFWLRYYDGSAWTTVQTWARGTDFENNNFYSAVVTLDSGTFSFPSDAQFRFQCDASGNGDHIYIDEVVITASNGSGSRIGKNEVVFLRSLDTSAEGGIGSLRLFPNPVTQGVLNVEVLDLEATQYVIYNLLGQQVAGGQYIESINVSALNSGMYIIEVTDGEETLVERFVKK